MPDLFDITKLTASELRHERYGSLKVLAVISVAFALTAYLFRISPTWIKFWMTAEIIGEIMAFCYFAKEIRTYSVQLRKVK